jgi:hypothetical protein
MHHRNTPYLPPRLLLPPALLEVLEQQGYDAFSKKFYGDTVSDELVWNKACRKFLASEIGNVVTLPRITNNCFLAYTRVQSKNKKFCQVCSGF